MGDWSAEATQCEQSVGPALRLAPRPEPDVEHFATRQDAERLDQSDAEDEDDGCLGD